MTGLWDIEFEHPEIKSMTCGPRGAVGAKGPTGGPPSCSGDKHLLRPNENRCYCGIVLLTGPVLSGARGVIL